MSVVVWFFFVKQKTAYEMLRSLVGSEMCIRDRELLAVLHKLRHVFAEEGEWGVRNHDVRLLQ